MPIAVIDPKTAAATVILGLVVVILLVLIVLFILYALTKLFNLKIGQKLEFAKIVETVVALFFAVIAVLFIVIDDDTTDKIIAASVLVGALAVFGIRVKKWSRR